MQQDPFTMRRICFTLAVFALALAVRVGGPATIGPYDDAYHLKRIAYVSGHEVSRLRGHELGILLSLATSQPRNLVTHGLRSLDFDADRGERGAFCPWPPLYDLAMGGVAGVAGIGSIVWIAPLLFAAFSALLTLVPARTWGITSGVVAGCGVALSPYLIGISRIGSIDHHWVEPMLVVAILAAVVRRSAAGLAMAMTAALFVQTALIVACGLALIAIVSIDRSRPALRAGVVAFSIAAAAVSFYAATRPAGEPGGPWFLGAMHAVLLAAAALACAVALLSLSLRERVAATDAQWSSPPGEGRASRTAAALALACGAFVLIPLAQSLAKGAHFFAGDPWLRSIVEFQPMFRNPSRIGTDLANLGGGVIALLLAIGRRPDESCGRAAARPYRRAILALFAIAYLLLAISSRRFLVPGIALFVIGGAMAASSRNRLIRFAAILLTLAPPIAYDVYAFTHAEPQPNDAVVALAEEVAPLPPGRVLAPWHAGHAIDVFGGHAVVIDNFGSMPGAAAFASANAALLEASPAALAAWCRARDVRYLALADPVLHLPAAAACAGLDPQLYARTPLAGRTVWARLWKGEPLEGFTRIAPHVWRVSPTT